MLSINTNTASMAAVNAINKSSASLSTSMERLATGNRINSSADDAAGKQIASRLSAQSDGMGVALSNIQDATAMLQTADSMFDEMTDVLGRMKDLSTQAANGTYNSDDLQAMQDEYDELGQQMSDMLQNTTYGGTNLFGTASGSNTGVSGLFQSAVTFQVGAESSDTMTVDISSQLGDLVTDLTAVSDQKKLESGVLDLYQRGFLTEEAYESIFIWDIWKFLESSLGRRMALAQKEGKLHRERQFMIGIPASEMQNGPKSEELVLIQGVIDAYIEEENGFILIDYKTDQVDDDGQ